MLPGVGVFGTGKLLEAVVPHLRSLGFHVVALWGQTLDDAAKTAAALKIDYHTARVDDVLLRRDVDLVLVLAPPSLQSQIAVKAMGIGKHVVCDRPAGLCQSELLKMVLAAQYYPSLLSVVGYGLRYLPAVKLMRQAVRDGYVGDVRLVEARVTCGSLLDGSGYSWLCEPAMGGGLLSLIGSHVIDLVSHVIGQRARRVHGTLRTYTRQTRLIAGIRHVASDDFSSFQMEMDGGALVTVSLNAHLSGLQQEVTVCGDWGHLTLRGADLAGFRAGQHETLHRAAAEEGAAPPLPAAGPQPALHAAGLLRLLTAVAGSFSAGEPLAEAASFQDGQYVTAVMEAVRASSATQAWTQVTLSQIW
ncbi:glucose-fructose oxidoreductase domain-containing protein 2-like [Amphibalanus amphitrite]|uniref:glucose-fructose oxidoreductase domain-containing protein 2-like n=1 Tax=Amphibalanus amphitrite TaxID=1232801 RepID=UPI001C915EBD|nr:glucose-fructose oxidoreductase domain-containing protein 2-like [Amphibalanus amphitrite]XP_043227973.1 glucose-fructose oxidoreductase domain-containing protein 2-like [Amphibalanus amphitrite]XP_043227974.1 glucose-fructose oxidoreductase domain-containing protein 2-like [Amphibalanus amphitrite]